MWWSWRSGSPATCPAAGSRPDHGSVAVAAHADHTGREQDEAEHHQRDRDVAEDLAGLGHPAALSLGLGLTAEDDRRDAEQAAAQQAEDAADQGPGALVAVGGGGRTAVGRLAVRRRRRRCVVAHGGPSVSATVSAAALRRPEGETITVPHVRRRRSARDAGGCGPGWGRVRGLAAIPPAR